MKENPHQGRSMGKTLSHCIAFVEGIDASFRAVLRFFFLAVWKVPCPTI
jgi:hypothetical protein